MNKYSGFMTSSKLTKYLGDLEDKVATSKKTGTSALTKQKLAALMPELTKGIPCS